MTSDEQLQALATAIKEVSDIEPSIPDEALSGNGHFFNQSVNGYMFNALGGKSQNNFGGGNQFQEENLYFGETFTQRR